MRPFCRASMFVVGAVSAVACTRGYNPVALDAGGPVDATEGAADGRSGLCTGLEVEYMCDDFEGAFASDWQLEATDGIIELVDEPVASGVGALRVARSVPGYSILTVPLPTIASGSLYARALVQRRGGALSDYAVVLEGRGAFGSGGKISVDLNAGGRVDLTGAGFASSADGVFPANTWKCVEFFIDIDSSDGTAWVQLDGERVVELSGSDTIPSAGFENFFIGISSPVPDQELFFDAFVLTADIIGCP